MTREQADTDMRAAVDRRLAERLAAARRRRETRERLAAEHAERRRHGLTARHRAKLDRTQDTGM